PSFPVIPGTRQLLSADGPSALLPNGNVLIAASPTLKGPLHMFEFDGSNLIEQPTIPNSSNNPSFLENMVVLPTGQVLMTSSSNDVEIYTPDDISHNSAWEPVIMSSPTSVKPGVSYTISGFLFNGMSQGSAFGDDYQSATNYPLVRITDLITGHVFYSR